MSILITNIGTSDLAIQTIINNPEFTIHGKKYYLPIDTLKEPNLGIKDLTSEEKEIYNNPQTYFKSSGLYKELGFTDDAIPTSRELTEKLLQSYQNNPDSWHCRICLPRILGVIKKAIEMNVKKGYIFVSNQVYEVLPNGNPGHSKDTVFLYDIIKLYINKAEIDFDLICENIPANIPLNNSDLLFGYYSNFFNRIRSQKEIEKYQEHKPIVNENILCKVIDLQLGSNSDDGVRVETETGLQGFIHIDNVSHEKIFPQQLKSIFKKGDRVWAKLIRFNEEKRKLRFSTKELEANPGDMIKNSQDVFQRINVMSEEVMLVSNKGGTGQMKTALQLQSMSISATDRLLFINPQLSIKDVFSGLSSQSQIESYWRYMRTQKYQTVRLLLERWDFDGAIQVFKDWQDYLDYLKTQGIIDKKNVEQSREFSNLISSALKFSLSCSNLDFKIATSIAEQGIKLAENYSDNINKDFSTLKNFTDNYYQHFQYRLLHLYTLNRINRQLEQNALFLTLLSTFCEEILHGLIINWDGNANYWKEQPESAKFELNVTKLENHRVELWNNFVTLQRQNKYTQNFGDRDIRFYTLNNRYNKRNFAESIVKYRNQEQEIEAWNQLSSILQKLDFWIDKRNDLIHSAKGLSWELMQELYNDYSSKHGDAQLCKPDEILPLIGEILKNPLINLSDDDMNNFVGTEANHYIYSFVRNWVVNQLIEDELQKSESES